MKRKYLAGAAMVATIAVVAAVTWVKFFRELPQELANDSMEEYFKYGSIGTENDAGMPYWIWLVLPKIFPEYLPGPGGYAAVGVAWEQGRELPVGFSKKTIGFPRVGINCALCHSATLRESASAPPTVFPGGPAVTFDALSYQRFLHSAANDARFNASRILREIAQIHELSALDKLLYRFIIIPASRKAILEDRERYAWTETRPPWGPGRIDPFNPVKRAVLEVDVGDTIGNSDMQPIWRLRQRVERGDFFHWDGLNTDLVEVVLSSAIGDGASPKSLPIERLTQMQEWLLDLKAPRFVDFFSVDAGLAARGSGVFAEHCASCHAPDGEQTGQLVDVSEVGTDPHRSEMWTKESAHAYNAYADGYDWDFEGFRSNNGYVSVPLDGIWLRAPYLHNGSVPSLADLLEPPAARPQRFYRGYDVYDPARMGFVSSGPVANAHGWLYDTSVKANSNAGHEWGTDLPPEDKRALLEYLKTL